MADHQVRPIAVWMLVYYAAFQETESVEYRSFKSHYADLFNGIQNPVSLSASLYAVDLQSRDTKKKINDFQITEDKVSELLDATETAIRLEETCSTSGRYSGGSAGLLKRWIAYAIEQVEKELM